MVRQAEGQHKGVRDGSRAKGAGHDDIAEEAEDAAEQRE